MVGENGRQRKKELQLTRVEAGLNMVTPRKTNFNGFGTWGMIFDNLVGLVDGILLCTSIDVTSVVVSGVCSNESLKPVK
jgi:hypothetical protein